MELSSAIGEEWRCKVRREGVLPLLSIYRSVYFAWNPAFLLIKVL